MRTKILTVLAVLGMGALALATPPALKMDSSGVHQARAFSAVDGGFNAHAGLSEFLPGFAGPLTAHPLAGPTPVITNAGTAGSTTYTYAIAACSTATCAAGSEGALGTTGSTTTGAASLTTTNYNIVTIPAVVGAPAFAVWRTVPTGASMGLLAVVAQTTCGNAGGFCGAVFNDQGGALIADLTPGLAGYGDAGPTVDQSTGLCIGSACALVFSGWDGTANSDAHQKLYCEGFDNYAIANGTAAAHDGGFVRTFIAAPSLLSETVSGTDGGYTLVPCTSSTTGFTCTAPANGTETLSGIFCGF